MQQFKIILITSIQFIRKFFNQGILNKPQVRRILQLDYPRLLEFDRHFIQQNCLEAKLNARQP